MASKQLSELNKGQIVTYNDCGQSLHDIAKKLNHHQSSTDDFLKTSKKAGNYHQKGHIRKRKTTTSMIKET